MEKYVYVLVCSLFLHTVSAITTYYMSEHCRGSISVDIYDQIRVRLSRSSSSYRSTQCSFTLFTSGSKRLMVYFKSLSIASSVYCSDNYLEIDDGSSRTAPCLTGSCHQCGYSTPGGVYMTSGSNMFLYYQTQSTHSYDNFDLVVTAYHTGGCHSSEHACANGRCIDSRFTCNGYNPCGDYSDCEFVLSVGGIAGIVIGGAVFLTIVIIVILLVRRRQRAVIVQRQPAPVASAITSSASSYGYNQPVPAQYPAPPYPRTQQGQYQQY